MGYHFYAPRVTIFDGSVAGTNVSGNTSQAFLVADFAQMSISWESNATANASLLTVWGTNVDGLTASITTWSVVTTLTAQGIYTVEPGMRWLRVTRPSNDTPGVVYLQART